MSMCSIFMWFLRCLHHEHYFRKNYLFCQGKCIFLYSTVLLRLHLGITPQHFGYLLPDIKGFIKNKIVQKFAPFNASVLNNDIICFHTDTAPYNNINNFRNFCTI